MKQKFILTSLFIILHFATCFAQIRFEFNSNYQYLKGSNAANLSSSWMTASYSPSGWSEGRAPFRYGDGEGGTMLNDMRNNYSSFYLRSEFTASNIQELEAVRLGLNFDDGFRIYINGKDVLSRNAPSPASHDSFSTEQHESGAVEVVYFDMDALNIKEGENLLAVQVFNTSLESSDVYFDVSIEAEKEEPLPEMTPDSLKVIFSEEAGFYEQNFDLLLSAPGADYRIVYTIDGSNPQTSSTAKNGGEEVTISINPDSGNGRARTPVFVVRASVKKGDLAPSFPTTKSFIFIDRVLVQSNPGGEWPTGNVNGQIIDLEMDRNISMSTTYGHQMEAALKDIPSICITSDMENIFGSGNGIYVNADGHGPEWERFCSVELIDSKSDKEFNVNAGLRIRGGWSRHDEYPKHAFRLFFRGEYGASKLRFPLFDEEGAEVFDKIDLRTAQNYAWSNGDSRNTMVREVFSRDSQRDMGQPYTRSRYYHLYLNGMYWGIYQTQERSEARFAADYLGGSSDDYDVVKVNTENYNYAIEATDGNLDAWKRVWDYTQTGYSSNAAYFRLEGKDRFGDPDPNLEKLVDIDNLIDYMLGIFYTGNFDAPTSSFGGNQGANNFYTIYKRDDKSKGFVFFNHDAEHAMMIENASPGIGLEENRVEPSGMNCSSFSRFHPQWLHHRLTENAEYRLRFADRALKHFENDGVFTPDIASKRFLERAKQIETAIIAESARWGDSRSNNRYTQQHWQEEIDHVVYDFFPYRTDIVIDQMLDAGIYSKINPPLIQVNANMVHNNRYTFKDDIDFSMSMTQSTGKIYYTTDGTDPRKIGGAVGDGAEEYDIGSSIKVNGTTWVKARVKSGNSWSALREFHLLKDWGDFYNLKITELHYHPVGDVVEGDSVADGKFEFLEIKNVGSHSVDLSRLFFEYGIDYEFPKETMLAPDNFYVVASSSKWFYERYGRAPSGVYKGALNNGGERIGLKANNGFEVFLFDYSDADPWNSEVDGSGYSLTTANVYPTGNPNDFSYWRRSSYLHGSPFYDDNGFPLKDDANLSAVGVKVYPNPVSQLLFVETGESYSNAELYTANGRRLIGQEVDGNSVIDLAGLNAQPGILILKLTGNGGMTTYKLMYRP